ncbi:MAG: glycosyltransferase family 9 protein [Methylobacter sp.]
MQCFYVKNNITLQLPHKQCELLAPSSEALLAQQIPTKNVYCGNVGWETIHAKQSIGEDGVVILPMTHEIQRILPPAITPWSAGQDIVTQLQNLIQNRPAEKRHQPIRLALLNGVGTMLGDTLVGSSAVEIAIRRLHETIGAVEVHAILAWNARPGTENIMARSPAVTYVQGHSITLNNLCSYDAYWDFSVLLRMEGYNSIPLIDFYLNSLGIDPESVSPAEKLPMLRLPTALIMEARSILAERSQGRKTVLIQGLASTPLRSMPDAFFAQLIADVLSETDVCVLLTQPLPGGFPNHYPDRIIHLEDWCRPSTDHYLSVVVAANAIISVDSLAIHAAMAAQIPGVVIFTTLSPALRLAYAPRLTGILIPEAEALSTWGKHKTDDNWPNEQLEYDQAWAAIDRKSILHKLHEIWNQSEVI